MRPGRLRALLEPLTVAVVLISLLLVEGACWAGPAAEQGLRRKVATLLGPLVENDMVSGTILISRGESEEYCQGFGPANRDHGIPNSCDTPFRIASISKSLTAVAILQLADRGLLALDDPVARFLPDYPQGDRIRVRHLLTHSSGLPSTPFIPGYEDKSRQEHDLEQSLEWIRDQSPKFEPGERFEYSNTGYILLSAIIEKASGMTFESYMDTRVFARAGMTRSGLDSWKRIVPGRATGYSRNGHGEVERAAGRNPRSCFGCGAFFATAPDLLRFMRALLRGELISKEAMSKMWSPLYETPWGDQYGLGWFIRQDRDRYEISARGGTSGFMSRLTYFPRREIIVVALLNQDFMLHTELFEALSAIALGGEAGPVLSTAVKDLGEHPLARFLGEYEMEDGAHLRFVLDDSGFFLEENPSNRFRVFPVDEHTGFAAEPNARLVFEPGPDENSVSLRAFYGVLLWRGERVARN